MATRSPSSDALNPEAGSSLAGDAPAAFRQREHQLRGYEVRLRAFQAEINAGRHAVDASPPVLAPADELALERAWRKLRRAREIFEDDERRLRQEQTAMRSQQSRLKARLDAVSLREAEVDAQRSDAPPPPAR